MPVEALQMLPDAGAMMAARPDPKRSSSLHDVERETWPHRFDFLMAATGYAVGLGNVWRFPYLCFRNGGGAFLIPYFLCAIFAGVPVFFLEVAMGQFMSEGTVTVWNMVPLFKGIGYGTIVIVTLLNVYYIVILAWALLYFFMSFNSVLPWDTCGNWWNTIYCYSKRSNSTLTKEQVEQLSKSKLLNDSVAEFWKRRVLQITDGIDQVGGIQWELAGTLLLAWVLCYFIIWKGPKLSSRIVYFTALFPYLMLLILLVRGLSLPGALDGIHFYLKPDFSRLLDSAVWIDAGTQIFFSYAVCTSAVVAMGSYNKYNHDCWRDSLLICVINSATSLFAGFVIFAVLGHMAYEEGVAVANVTDSGPGLAFIAYPKAITALPWAPFWAAIFFAMLVLLGIDSMFVGIEGFVTAVIDIWPTFRRTGHRELFIAVVCLLSCAGGLIMVTQGGMYVFQLFDYYSAASYVLLWFCFFECIAVAYFYGADRFYNDIERMIGYRIHPWCKWCWQFLSPAICLFIFCFAAAQYEPLVYDDKAYPLWADALGWLMALASMVWVPLTLGAALLAGRRDGESFMQRVARLSQPVFSSRHRRRTGQQQSQASAAPLIISSQQPIIDNEAPPPYAKTQSPGIVLIHTPQLSEADDEL